MESDVSSLLQGAEEILGKLAEMSPAFAPVLQALTEAKEHAQGGEEKEAPATVAPEQGGSGAMPFSHGRPQ